MTTCSTTAILGMKNRCARITRELAQASAAGLEPAILLGAEMLLFAGARAKYFELQRRALEREAVTLSTALVARDGHPIPAQLAGITYVIDAGPDRPAGTFTIRRASLEETARAYVHRLRSGEGTHLRRAQADALAATLDALLVRSMAPVRRVG